MSRGSWGRVAKLGVLVLLVIPLTTGCSVSDVIRFGWPEGVTPQGEAMRQLWTGSALAALAVGFVTWGAMFWAIIMHRKRKGSDDVPPRQTQYNLPLEIVFTVIPTIIVAVLFGFTINTQNYVEKDTPTDMALDITAFQWNWKFDYPGTKTPQGTDVSTLGTSETIPILVLPTGKSITFVQHSNDVIHSFFVPEFLFKRDVFPMPERNDQDNTWQIDSIDKEGAFVGRCAELCGSYHSQMNFEVRALPNDLYTRWLALRQQNNPATGVAYTAGEALGALNCGQLCTPTAYTTYPFTTDRTQRSASQPAALPATGN